MILLPKARTSPFPSASTSPATMPNRSSGILSDLEILFMEEGVHFSSGAPPPTGADTATGGGEGEGGRGEAAGAGARAVADTAGGAGAGEGTTRIAPCTPNS